MAAPVTPQIISSMRETLYDAMDLAERTLNFAVRVVDPRREIDFARLGAFGVVTAALAGVSYGAQLLIVRLGRGENFSGSDALLIGGLTVSLAILTPVTLLATNLVLPILLRKD